MSFLQHIDSYLSRNPRDHQHPHQLSQHTLEALTTKWRVKPSPISISASLAPIRFGPTICTIYYSYHASNVADNFSCSIQMECSIGIGVSYRLESRDSTQSLRPRAWSWRRPPRSRCSAKWCYKSLHIHVTSKFTDSLIEQVVLTDYPETALIDNLQFNVRQNLTLDEQDRVDTQVFFYDTLVAFLLAHLSRDMFGVIP